MCELNSLRSHPGARASLKFFPSFLWASSLPASMVFIEHPSLVDSPRCCSEVGSAGPQGFLEETMKGAPTILFGCLWFLLFLFSLLRSRAVTVILRVDGAIPSLFVH